MANVTETPQWEAGIYQLETTDKVIAGATGISNRQAKLLANRTGYLKAMRERGLFSGMTIDDSPTLILGSDAGRVKNFVAGASPVNCTIPTIVSDIIKVGETVTIMNSQSEGEITLVRAGGSTDDIYYQDQLITTYKVRPYCSATLLNNGTAWQVINTYERQSIHGVGEIISYPTLLSGAAGKGLLLCNGAAVSRTGAAALFAAIGTTFGVGDGSTTFNLPNYPTTIGGVSIRYYIRY